MDSEKLNKTLSWVFAALALLAGLYALGFLIAQLIHYHSPVLKGDQWSEAGRVQDFTDLFSAHNEHRIVFARLVFALDNMFGGTQIINKTANLLLMGSMLFALTRLINKGGVQLSSPLGTAVIGVSLATGFSLVQSENFEWGFQVQFFAVYAFAAFTLLSASSALMTDPKDGLPTLLALSPAFFFYLLTTASMANGVLLGLVLATYIFLADQKYRWRAGLIVLIASLILIFVYFALWEGTPGGGGNGNRPEFIDIVKADPLSLPQYVMGVIGSVFTWARATPMGSVMTLIATLAFIWTVRTGLSAIPLAFLALFGFCILTALVITYGRLPFGAQFAASSRYTTISVLALMSLIGWFAVTIGTKAPTSGATLLLKTGLAFSIFIVSLYFALSQPRYTAYFNVMWQGRLNAEAALINKSVHSAATERMGAPPNLMGLKMPYLIDNELSLFARRPLAPIGEPLSNFGKLDTALTCNGHFDSLKNEYRENSVSGNVRRAAQPFLNETGIIQRAHGWAVIENKAPKRLFLADGNGDVVAEAKVGFPRTDLKNAGVKYKGKSPGWVAYFYFDREEPDAISAFAMTNEGSLCIIDSWNLNPARSARPTNKRIPVRRVIADIGTSENWQQRAGHENSPDAPQNLEWWGSWVGGDANTGSIVFNDIKIPKDQRTMKVIMMTGPDATGQSITLIDQNSGDEKIISGFPDLPDWTSLEIDLPDGWRKIDVKITDAGPGWGQWSATAGVWFERNTTPKDND